ncbi:MAG TPA: FtsX-like permease family protein [Trebonia sp.]|jgi:ABC-type antimicrobial peptide transport system permease subunit
MIRLGLQLTLRSGREAMVRLLITAAAVAVGVALLLGVLAELHAYEANAYQQCWSCTTGTSVPAALPAHGELWNDSADFYQGQTLSRLDVAALGQDAPVPPGVSRLPAPGTYYASPALATLLKAVPADELGDRFPGKLAGTIGQAALNGTNDLVIYIGYTPAELNQVPGTTWVTSIYTGAAQQVFSPFFKYAFYIGVIAVLLPMLVLISTATRLAADRREERFAALRLVGGTPSDIRQLATVESVVSAFAGAVGGIIIFLLVRSLLAGSALLGTAYFESNITPTLAGYAGVLVLVPAAAAVAALISLRRVQITPLGVSRRAKPKPPTFWRLTVLVIGLALYVYGLKVTNDKSIGAAAYPGLIVTMIGLVIAGPWITAVASRLFGRAAQGSSALLATRRLADNPRAAFRSVSGLVLAIFLGTMVGILAPAVNEVQSTPSAGALSNYLIGQVGLSPSAGQQLIRGIDAIPGATVYPLYGTATASAPAGGTTGHPGSGPGSAGKGGKGSGSPAGNGARTAAPPSRKQVQYFNNQVAMSCAGLRAIGALGRCAPGLTAIQTTDASLFDDNPKYQTQPIAGASDPAYTGDLTTLPLQAVLVRVGSPATLERVRTYLAVLTAPQTGAGYGSSPTPPRTFGETLQIRTARASLAEKIVYAAVALTLIVAGCSLAVTVGGGLVDRKRPFTLLRVSGTSVGVLTRVVMLEAAVPLVAATVLAGGIAYGTSILAFMRLAPAGTALPQLGRDYFTIMGIGLAIAFGVILVTLPLLRRMTAPSTVRFE